VIVGSLLGSALCFVAFVVAELRAPEPLIPFDLFRVRMLSASSVIAITVGLAMFGVISFLPLYVRVVMGSSAIGAGQVLTPLLVAMVVGSIIVSRVVIRRGYRLCMAFGFLMLGIGAVALLQLTSAATRFDLSVAMVFCGAGMGIVFTPMNLAAQSSVDLPRMGVAMGLINFVRQLGAAFGVAASSAVLLSGLASELTARFPGRDVDASELLTPGASVPGGAAAADEVREAFAAALHSVFVLTAVFVVVGALTVLLMPRGSAVELRDEAHAHFEEELAQHPEEAVEYGVEPVAEPVVGPVVAERLT
jgi:Na+/melibiose symporter-like transporter